MSLVLALPPQNILASLNGFAQDMLAATTSLFATQAIGDVTGTNPVLSGKMQESDNGSSWSDVVNGAFAPASADNNLQTVNFTRGKRYIRYVATVTGTTPEFPTSVVMGDIPNAMPPVVSARRLTDTSMTVDVRGEDGTYYETWAIPQPLTPTSTRYGIGGVTGPGTLTREGLVSGSDYLVFSVPKRGVNGSYLGLPGFTAVSLASSDTVLAAFRSALAANVATRAALSGGLWANEVPEDRELPYGFIELLDSRFLWTMEDFHVEVAKVRLHVYAVGGQACESLTRQVRQLYDWNNLPFATDGTSSTCQVQPTDYCVQSEFARLNTGDIVYQGTVEYEVMVNRNTLRG